MAIPKFQVSGHGRKGAHEKSRSCRVSRWERKLGWLASNYPASPLSLLRRRVAGRSRTAVPLGGSWAWLGKASEEKRQTLWAPHREG